MWNLRVYLSLLFYATSVLQSEGWSIFLYYSTYYSKTSTSIIAKYILCISQAGSRKVKSSVQLLPKGKVAYLFYPSGFIVLLCHFRKIDFKLSEFSNFFDLAPLDILFGNSKSQIYYRMLYKANFYVQGYSSYQDILLRTLSYPNNITHLPLFPKI